MKKSSISQNILEIKFPKLRKQNFMYFGRKHVETGPNYSHV